MEFFALPVEMYHRSASISTMYTSKASKHRFKRVDCLASSFSQPSFQRQCVRGHNYGLDSTEGTLIQTKINAESSD